MMPKTANRTVLVRPVTPGVVEVVPTDWVEAESAPHEREFTVVGGFLRQQPDAVSGALPRALVFEVEDAAAWLADVYGESVAAAVAAAQHAETEGETEVEAVPAYPELVESFRLLCRADWYRRWWPSGDPTDESLPVLDEDLLGVDLGVLAWECADLFEDESLARQSLREARARLVVALARARDLTGDLRVYAEERLASAVSGAVDLADRDDDDPALDALVAARRETAEADRLIEEAQSRWDEVARDWEGAELAYQAEGGAVVDDSLVSVTTVDWAMVPSRSVSGRENNVTIVGSVASGGLRLEVFVEGGDHGAEDPLVAWVHEAATGHLVARVVLGADGRRYRGHTVTPFLSPARFGTIDVHVVVASLMPAPGASEMPWRDAWQQEQAPKDRAFIRSVVAAHRADRTNLETRPLLCELDVL